MKNTGAILIATAILSLLGLFFFWPLALTVKSAFVFNRQWTLAIFRELVQNPLYIEGLLNSLALAIVTGALGALLTFVIARILGASDRTKPENRSHD